MHSGAFSLNLLRFAGKRALNQIDLEVVINLWKWNMMFEFPLLVSRQTFWVQMMGDVVQNNSYSVFARLWRVDMVLIKNTLLLASASHNHQYFIEVSKPDIVRSNTFGSVAFLKSVGRSELHYFCGFPSFQLRISLNTFGFHLLPWCLELMACCWGSFGAETLLSFKHFS